jgi:hypothetical protein
MGLPAFAWRIPGLKTETPNFLYVVLYRTACFQVRRFTSDCEPYEEPSSMKLISRTQSAGRLRDAMSRGFCAPGRGTPSRSFRGVSGRNNPSLKAT